MTDLGNNDSDELQELAMAIAREAGLQEPDNEILKVARRYLELRGLSSATDDPHPYREALELALERQGWTVGNFNDGYHGRIAIEHIDGMEKLITDLFVVKGALGVTTHLPILITAPRRYEASLFCSASNAAGGWVLSVSDTGVPVLFSRCYLGPNDELAAAQIVDVVRSNRSQANTLTGALRAIAHGETAATVASTFDQTIPFDKPFPTACSLDLAAASRKPSPDSEEDLEKFRDHPDITVEEITAIVRMRLLNKEQPDARPCAGPLVIHADGTAECHACSNPEARIHIGGTAGCSPDARLGYGHICGRCDAS